MKLRARFQSALAIVGPIVVWLIAWITSSIGDQPRDGLALANVALVLAGVTVALASFSWVAGLTTSVVAALALNFFHTVPFRSFRISSNRDVGSVVLLAIIGLGVSAATAWRVRRATLHGTALGAARAREDLAALTDDVRPVQELWQAALAAASRDLPLVTATVTSRPPVDAPVIARRAWTNDSTLAVLTLPQTGAVLRFRNRHNESLLLVPEPGVGALTVDRRAVIAFADVLELALAPLPAGPDAARPQPLTTADGLRW